MMKKEYAGRLKCKLYIRDSAASECYMIEVCNERNYNWEL
jgi:hypothetical protein